MGIVAERLDSLVLREITPDGRVEGVYRTAGGAALSFKDRAYHGYTERGLESQLGRLCMRLWASYRRAYAEALAEATGREVKQFLHPPRDPDAVRNRFREEQAATVSRGMSAGELVYIETTGLVRWHVVIRDGTVGKLDEDAFAQEATSAFDALMTDYRDEMFALREKHYGES